MADDTEETTTTDETTDTEMGSESEQSTAKPDIPVEVRRQLREANREAAKLRARVAEFENKDKTETQKLTERAEAAERAAADASSKLMRFSVAAEKKLPASLAARLQGSTEDELRADADELLKLLPSGGGAPSFDGGARTTADAPKDMNALIRQAAGRG